MAPSVSNSAATTATTKKQKAKVVVTRVVKAPRKNAAAKGSNPKMMKLLDSHRKTTTNHPDPAAKRAVATRVQKVPVLQTAPSSDDPFRYKKLRQSAKDLATAMKANPDASEIYVGPYETMSTAAPAQTVTNGGETFRVIPLKGRRHIRFRPSSFTNLDNVLAAPENYPNVEIVFGEGGEAVEARVREMSESEFAVALEASLARARASKRKTATTERKAQKTAGRKPASKKTGAGVKKAVAGKGKGKAKQA